MVYVSPDAKGAVFAPGVELPPGTELVMVTLDHTTHRPGPTFFMQKVAPTGGAHATTSGPWRYGTRESAATKDAGLAGHALCARCHDEAPGDHVFRLPD